MRGLKMIKERPMIYIIEYLQEYDYPEFVISDNKKTNILACKIMYYLDRSFKTANIHNKVKYTTIKRLAFELDISREELLRVCRKLHKLGYIDFWLDNFTSIPNNDKYAQYCNIERGATRFKACLTNMGKLELYPLINKTKIPLQNEYIETLG